MHSLSPLSSGWRGLFGRALAPKRPAPAARRRDDDRPTAANSSAIGWSRFPETRTDPPGDGFAARRLQLADEIARELITRPDLQDAPALVQDFLLRTWPLVIAHARLAGMATRGRLRYVAAVDELLWSVRMDATLRQPPRLMRLLPRLLETLRAGIALLGQREQAGAAAFFMQLERMHRPVLKLCAARRQELLPGIESAPTSAGAPERMMESLQVGNWVELYSRQRWVRARLHWMDPQARQYLFCSAHGGLHALSRRLLEALVHDRRIRPAGPPDPSR
jgi:hypothetical protein